MVFEVLYRVIDIFKSYFDGAFDEDAIRNHFVLTYELLDGMFLPIIIATCSMLKSQKSWILDTHRIALLMC